MAQKSFLKVKPKQSWLRVMANFWARFAKDENVLDILNDIGHMPLPPYVDRPDSSQIEELLKLLTVKNQVQLQRQQQACILMIN